MRALWLSLMATSFALAPIATSFAFAPVATSFAFAPVESAAARDVLVAQAADDDDDDADGGEAAATGAAAAPADTTPSPMAPAEAPMAGLPASAMNADQLKLPPLSKSSQDVPDLVLGSAEKDFSVNRKHFILRAGQAYRWKISSAGSLEYKLHAPEFFRNIWFNQIVISDLELHMAGPPAWLEYDARGTIQVQFNTVRPGNFTWYIEGLDGAQDMKGTITVVP